MDNLLKEPALEEEPTTATETELLESLGEGDAVEILDNQGATSWRGTVETTAPELGVAWIRTEIGERKLINLQEFQVIRLPGPISYPLNISSL